MQSDRDILKLVYSQVVNTQKSCKKAIWTEDKMEMYNSALEGIRCTLKAALGEDTGSNPLVAIHELMSGEEWSPDTLDSIAEILEQAGFPVRDCQQETE